MVWLTSSHLINYLIENVYCLFYGFDLLASKYMLFASYLDLITDISEAFGVWVALLVLVLSAITSMLVVQQVITYSLSSLKRTVTGTQTNESVNLSNYRYFLNSFSKKNI